MSVVSRAGWLAAAVLSVAALSSWATAGCPPFGTAISSASGDQTQLAVASGYSYTKLPCPCPTYMHAVWRDDRDSLTSGADIYFWSYTACSQNPAGGQPMCTEAGPQELPSLAFTGYNYSVVAAWQDGRSGLDLDIYARRMWGGYPYSTWDSTSIAVCSVPGDQSEAVVVFGGLGGAIVGWVDRRSGSADIYAQRLDGSGASQWTTNGLPACVAVGDQTDLAGMSDGLNSNTPGVILCWLDRRAGDAIFATRIAADGTLAPGWNPDGNPVVEDPGRPRKFVIVPDGGSGLFIFWTDYRADPAGDIYGQHLLADGTRAAGWKADGLPICTASGAQVVSDAASDVAYGASGAYVVWEDERNASPMESPPNADIYAQRVTANGAALWTAEGQVVCDDAARQEHARAILVNAGCLLAVWSDQRGGADAPDIYAMRLLPDGGFPGYDWVPNGVLICGAPDAQDFPTLVADSGTGGALIGWVDHRDRQTSGADLYGNWVTWGGNVDAPSRAPAAFDLGLSRPNPAPGRVSFALDLPAEEWVDAGVVDLAARTVLHLARRIIPAGRHTLVWDGHDASGARAAPGVYFLRVRVGTQVLARRLTLLR